jgi:acylglycerol lipase
MTSSVNDTDGANDAAALPPGAVGPGNVLAYAGAGDRTLRYREVKARGAERHRLLYMHGIESHGTWFLPAAQRLAEHGVTTWLLDRRGSGLNRDQGIGDAAGADELLEDVRRFRDHVGDSRIVIVGLSWGGKLALAAALDRPVNVRAVVLLTPGLKNRLALSFKDLVAVVLDLAFRRGKSRFRLPIEPDMFTRLPPYLEFIRHDPLRVDSVTARLLLASRDLDRRNASRMKQLAYPVLLLLASRDRIVDNDGVVRALGALAPGLLEVVTFDDADHSLQFERLDGVVAEVVTFLGKVAP